MKSYILWISIFALSCQSSPVQQKEIVRAALPVQSLVAGNKITAIAVDKEEIMGKFNPAENPDFVPVGKPYSSRPGMLLRTAAFEAFKKMFAAAKKDGIALNIISSTRNFEQQKGIWEGKWKRFAAETPDAQKRALKILEYSSMPGTSRHHWGSDIDLNDLNNGSFEGKGKHRKAYEWLVKNAATYGFGQPYTAKGAARPDGYNEEKWHWSYLPIAKPNRDAYLQMVKNKDIDGFLGSESAVLLDIVKNYVGGVSAACQ